MAEHNIPNDSLDFLAPDGSYQEKTLDYLSQIITNTGGGTSNGIVNKFGYNLDIEIASSPEIVASFV